MSRSESLREWMKQKASPVASLILAAVIIGGSVGLAARAEASPVDDYTTVNAGRICATLREYPTVAGVTGLVGAVLKESGFTPYQTGEVIATAVLESCPEYLPVLQRFVAAYSGDAGTVRI